MKKISLLLVFAIILSCFSSFTILANEKMTPVDIRYNSFDVGKLPEHEAKYTSDKFDYSVSLFPASKQKSLHIKTSKDGSFNIDVDLEKNRFDNLCMEISLCYVGNLSTSKDLFIINRNGENIPLLKADSKGVLTYFDSTKVGTLSEASLYRISLLLDFNKNVCSVLVNNNLRLRKELPKMSGEISNIGFDFKDATSDNENIYVKYIRAYESDKITNDTDRKVPKIPDTSKYPQKIVTDLTDKEVNERLSDMVLLTSKTNRARVYNEVVEIDPENPLIKPEMINDTLMLPYEFASKILSANVNRQGDMLTFTKGTQNIVFTLSSPTAKVNGREVKLSNPMVELNSTLYVPSKEFCEAFGKTSTTINLSTFTVITTKGNELDLLELKEIEILNKGAREVVFEYPTTDEIVATFNENTSLNHPRLFFDKDGLNDIRERMKTEPVKTWAQDVINVADGYLVNLPLIDYVLPDGVRMGGISQNVQSCTTTLGMAYLLTQDVKYADKCIEVMMLACNPEVFPDWHPWHFLDVGEMAFGIGVGFDWCYDRLTQEQKNHITKTLEKYAFETLMDDFWDRPRSRSWEWSRKLGNGALEAYPQNWVDVCTGGIVTSALAVCDEDALENKTILGDMLREGMYRLQDFLDTMAPDGVFRDGTSYWVYANNYKIALIDAMNNILGTNYGLTNAIGFEDCFVWLAQVTGPKGTFNFENNPQEHLNTYHFFWLSDYTGKSEYNEYRLAQMKEHSFKGNWHDIAWYVPSQSSAKLSLPNEIATKGMGNLVLRNGFDSTSSWLAAFTSNPEQNGYTHQECDSTFVVDLNGTRWVCDLGKEQATYTGSLERIKYYSFRAEGHNTVIIQPSVDHNHNPFAVGKLEKLEANDNMSYAIYDYTDKLAYKGCSSWKRGYKLDKEQGNVIIQDELTALKGVEYYWFMHTEADIELLPDKRSAIFTRDNKKVLVTLKSPDKSLKFEISEAIGLETSPPRIDPEENDNSKFKKLVVHAEDITKVDMSVELSPLYGSEPSYISEYNYLSDWELSQGKLDTSLTLSSILVNGERIEGFTSDKTSYEVSFGFDSLVPEISATSDNGVVEVSDYTVDNVLTRIKVKANDGSGKFNSYVIYSKPFDYASLKGNASTNPEYIGTLPENYKKVEGLSVKADLIPQDENNPSNLIDGNHTTRYSVNSLGTYAEFDLKETYTLSYVGVAHPFGTRSEYFLIVTSQDGIHWDLQLERGTKITNNSDMQYFKLANPTKARYVRIYDCGNSSDNSLNGWWSIGEVEFWYEGK